MGFKAQAQACDLSKYFFHEILVISGFLSQKRSVRDGKEKEERHESGGEIEPEEVSLTPIKVFSLVHVINGSRGTSLMHKKSLLICPHLHSDVAHHCSVGQNCLSAAVASTSHIAQNIFTPQMKTDC